MFKLIFLSTLFIIPLFSLSQIKSKAASDEYSKNNSATIQLYLIKDGDKYGYINKDGKIIIKPQFEEAKDFKDDFAIIKISGKYGFINQSGIIVINPIYEDLQDFSEGLARIKLDAKYGFIDKKGKILIRPQFDYVESFSNGIAEIKIAGKFGFINTKGEIVTNPRFDEVSYFSEGLAKIKIDGKYGFINLKGEIVIQPKFSEVNMFSEGLALVSIVQPWEELNSYGYINKVGDFVITPKFGADSGPFKEGLAAVCIESVISQRKFKKFGYINKKGAFVIELQFATANFFNEGLAWVSYSESGNSFLASDAKWGCIDKAGKFVINPQDYFACNPFFEGLSCVWFKVEGAGKFGFINRSDSIVIPPQFSTPQNFHNGFAEVQLGEDWGIVDKSGKFFKGWLIGELIRVRNGKDFGYTDKKGNWIWKPQ